MARAKMDRMTVSLVVAAWAVAIAVIYHRFSSTEVGEKAILRMQTMLSSRLMRDRRGTTCGLLRWNNYTILSKRVVLPDGVRPAASGCILAGRQPDGGLCTWAPHAGVCETGVPNSWGALGWGIAVAQATFACGSQPPCHPAGPRHTPTHPHPQPAPPLPHFHLLCIWMPCSSRRASRAPALSTLPP
jgi:hypothetical protein